MSVRSHPRVLAFDEGPFRFENERVVVAGVMTRGAAVVEAIVLGDVAVDGWDATDTAIGLTRRLPGAGPDLVLIDGITLGGLNLVDLPAVHTALDRPVLGVTRKAPDRAALERAVANAPEPERRRATLPHDPPVAVRLGAHTLHVQAAPSVFGESEIADLLRPAIAEGALPEPLRLAHHVATAVVRGVSGTKA